MSEAEFWARVDAVFAAAVELDGDLDARAALIAAEAGGDDTLQAEVRSLLDAHDRSGGFLGPVPDGRPDPLASGTAVGVYRLVEKIGEGGMGDVYRAERADGAFGRAVALKVTRGSIVDPDAAGRFRTERQILATLQHPHIVTLLDGGTLPDGRAYLVMELIDGLPITRYCADRGLGLFERLALFRQVCAAAHYAHRHAIVHRDLKPANVLVTPDGVAKVLDFGVAKLLAAEPGDGVTVPGLLPGPLTPNYASPEQLRGLPVTTASDVYALGVLLFELVTGTRPYETTGQPLDRVVDLVVHTDPPRPSAVTPASGAGPAPDRRRLRGDLDAIVLKALAKDPDARYGSAEQLAEDLDRFTAGLPVTAREPSAVYLLRKLASRHRVAAVLGGLAAAGVLAALGVALWQRHVAERERLRAEARFADVRALANTLIFQIHDAIVPLPGSTPVRKTIVAEALRYLKSLQQESDADLRLRFELAGAYQRIAFVLGYPQASNLGDRDGALAALRQAEQLIAGQAMHPDAPIDTIDRYVSIQRQLSVLSKTMGRDAEARTAIAAALRRAEQLHARDPRERRGRELLAHSLFDVAWGTGDHRASLPIWQRAGALYEGLLAEQPADVNAMRNVALVEKYLGGRLETLKEPAEALRHYQRALDLDERRLARLPDDPLVRLDTAIDLGSVAAALEAGNDFARSIPLRVRSVEMRRVLHRADPQNVWIRGRLGKALMEFARAEARIGQLDAAIGHARESVATLRVAAMTTPDVIARSELADALQVVASIEGLRGNRMESCRAYREAVAMFAGANRDRPTYRHLAEEGLRACGSS